MTLKSTLITAALLLSISSAQAALVETDWKTEGDALATLDTETGIEWLDLTQTDSMSISQVEVMFDGTLSGWRLPTVSEVADLIRHAFPSQVLLADGPSGQVVEGEGVDGEADAFRMLLGITHVNTKNDYTQGMFKSNNNAGSVVARSGVYDTRDNNEVVLYSKYALPDNFDYSSTNHTLGVYLVSDGGTTLSSQQDPSINANNENAPINNVSTPAMAGGLIALIGMGWVRRRALEVTR